MYNNVEKPQGAGHQYQDRFGRYMQADVLVEGRNTTPSASTQDTHSWNHVSHGTAIQIRFLIQTSWFRT